MYTYICGNHLHTNWMVGKCQNYSLKSIFCQPCFDFVLYPSQNVSLTNAGIQIEGRFLHKRHKHNAEPKQVNRCLLNVYNNYILTKIFKFNVNECIM